MKIKTIEEINDLLEIALKEVELQDSVELRGVYYSREDYEAAKNVVLDKIEKNEGGNILHKLNKKEKIESKIYLDLF